MDLYLSNPNNLVFSPDQVVPNYQSFVYNPNDPVPTIGGNNLVIECGPRDQSILYQRGDILSYVTEPLPENFLVCGQMEAVSAFFFNLKFST